MADTKAANEPLIALKERVKKDKQDSDDTTSYEGDSDKLEDFERTAKAARRSRRKSYKSFKKENKVFWMWFNFAIAFFSAGFLVGTYLIVDSNPEQCGSLLMT